MNGGRIRGYSAVRALPRGEFASYVPEPRRVQKKWIDCEDQRGAVRLAGTAPSSDENHCFGGMP